MISSLRQVQSWPKREPDYAPIRQGFLLILDAMVDLCDRRSAALEQTENFKLQEQLWSRKILPCRLRRK